MNRSKVDPIDAQLEALDMSSLSFTTGSRNTSAAASKIIKAAQRAANKAREREEQNADESSDGSVEEMISGVAPRGRGATDVATALLAEAAPTNDGADDDADLCALDGTSGRRELVIQGAEFGLDDDDDDDGGGGDAALQSDVKTKNQAHHITQVKSKKTGNYIDQDDDTDETDVNSHLVIVTGEEAEREELRAVQEHLSEEEHRKAMFAMKGNDREEEDSASESESSTSEQEDEQMSTTTNDEIVQRAKKRAIDRNDQPRAEDDDTTEESEYDRGELAEMQKRMHRMYNQADNVDQMENDMAPFVGVIMYDMQFKDLKSSITSTDERSLYGTIGRLCVESALDKSNGAMSVDASAKEKLLRWTQKRVVDAVAAIDGELHNAMQTVRRADRAECDEIVEIVGGATKIKVMPMQGDDAASDELEKCSIIHAYLPLLSMRELHIIKKNAQGDDTEVTYRVSKHLGKLAVCIHTVHEFATVLRQLIEMRLRAMRRQLKSGSTPLMEAIDKIIEDVAKNAAVPNATKKLNTALKELALSTVRFDTARKEAAKYSDEKISGASNGKKKASAANSQTTEENADGDESSSDDASEDPVLGLYGI